MKKVPYLGLHLLQLPWQGCCSVDRYANVASAVTMISSYSDPYTFIGSKYTISLDSQTYFVQLVSKAVGRIARRFASSLWPWLFLF